MSGVLPNFSLHFITEKLKGSFSMKIIFLYEISAALFYMGEMSTPTTHWRSIPCLAENFENFLSSLSTGHEKCVWSPIVDFFFPLLLFGGVVCV